MWFGEGTNRIIFVAFVAWPVWFDYFKFTSIVNWIKIILRPTPQKIEKRNFALAAISCDVIWRRSNSLCCLKILRSLWQNIYLWDHRIKPNEKGFGLFIFSLIHCHVCCFNIQLDGKLTKVPSYLAQCSSWSSRLAKKTTRGLSATHLKFKGCRCILSFNLLSPYPVIYE